MSTYLPTLKQLQYLVALHEHGHFGRVRGIRVEDARADLYATGRLRDRGKDDQIAAQEEVVGDPKLVEAGGFGGLRQRDVGGQSQVVVETQAEADHGTLISEVVSGRNGAHTVTQRRANEHVRNRNRHSRTLI